MAWFKVDDAFHASRKVKSIPPRQRLAAVGLWAIAGSWCSQEKTDGYVPEYMLREWGATAKTIGALVQSGLWAEIRGGFEFRSWLDYNPSKAQVEAERAASKARMSASRERKRAKGAGSAGASDDVAPQHPSNTPTVLQRPDPTRPDPTHKEEKEPCSTAPRSNAGYPASFEEFWTAYPRRQKKGDALKAWRKAVKRTTEQSILDGAHRLRDDPNREDQFTPLAASWLNADGWEDEPLPERGKADEGLTTRQRRFLESESLRDSPDPRTFNLTEENGYGSRPDRSGSADRAGVRLPEGRPPDGLRVVGGREAWALDV